MSFLFTLEEDKLAEQLPALLTKYEKRIAAAEPLFELEGKKIADVMRDLALHQAKYAMYMQEAKQLVQWLGTYREKIEARMLHNLHKTNQRTYSAGEQKQVINGTREMVEQNQLITEASLIYGQLFEIVEALKQLAWMCGHTVKLRVAELGDVEF